MALFQYGGLRIFRFLGIGVFVHWSWAIVAVVELQARHNAYSTQAWNVAEYLTVFALVLLHEFGHALACRSVGGTADRILLWPLGGVAYVNPPNRPGAYLWSIAAGPLVNFALVPFTILAGVSLTVLLPAASDDLQHYVFAVGMINAGLLIFNLLPIYPLDGGQILRSLLWFIIGPARSLSAVAIIGLIGALGIVALAVRIQGFWLIVLAAYAASRSWAGLQAARAMAAALQTPRHVGVRCPACREAPPVGELWSCPCGARFDTFTQQGLCPGCGRGFAETHCPLCGQSSPLPAWRD